MRRDALRFPALRVLRGAEHELYKLWLLFSRGFRLAKRNRHANQGRTLRSAPTKNIRFMRRAVPAFIFPSCLISPLPGLELAHLVHEGFQAGAGVGLFLAVVGQV